MDGSSIVDGFYLYVHKGDEYQGHAAPTWPKWSPRNPKWKCLAPYD